MTVQDVAVLIPAHNEELVIEASIAAIAALVPRRNIHVVSDGSTDRTAELARRAGVHVIETRTNVGKAGALEEAIERFGLVAAVRCGAAVGCRYDHRAGIFRRRSAASSTIPRSSRWPARSGPTGMAATCRWSARCWCATGSVSTRSASGC